MKQAVSRLIQSALDVDHHRDVGEALAGLSAPFHHAARLVGQRQAQRVLRRGVVFVHVPKCAGTSVAQALYGFSPGHASVRYYRALLGTAFDRLPSFSLVRDPEDRFLSAWRFLAAGGGEDVAVSDRARARLDGVDSIDSLLDRLEALNGRWLGVDTILRPQWWYLVDHWGCIGVQHLWTTDAIGEDLGPFLARLGATPAGHLNRSRPGSASLSPGQRARLERLYPADFALVAAVRRQSAPHSLAGRPLAELAEAGGVGDQPAL